jgi:hypothetical protein
MYHKIIGSFSDFPLAVLGPKNCQEFICCSGFSAKLTVGLKQKQNKTEFGIISFSYIGKPFRASQKTLNFDYFIFIVETLWNKIIIGIFVELTCFPTHPMHFKIHRYVAAPHI